MVWTCLALFHEGIWIVNGDSKAYAHKIIRLADHPFRRQATCSNDSSNGFVSEGTSISVDRIKKFKKEAMA